MSPAQLLHRAIFVYGESGSFFACSARRFVEALLARALVFRMAATAVWKQCSFVQLQLKKI
ncbi:hypothetical protein CR51_09890 [Caballeronia megalochromosomata]|nr:hypothetical protein CR51_09890 [Caballeronia megalochromosomata]